MQDQLSIHEHWQFSNANLADYETTCDYFQLSHCDRIPAKQLSAGQRKKASLMSLLMRKKPIWILDEPLVAIDAESNKRLMTLIEQHLAEQGMVIITSHQSLPHHSCQVRECFL